MKLWVARNGTRAAEYRLFALGKPTLIHATGVWVWVEDGSGFRVPGSMIEKGHIPDTIRLAPGEGPVQVKLERVT